MEVTKRLKPSISVSRNGDSASVQAATRVNAKQASKRTMCRPTRLPYRGRLKWLGELSEEYAQLLHRGIGGGMYARKAYVTRSAGGTVKLMPSSLETWRQIEVRKFLACSISATVSR